MKTDVGYVETNGEKDSTCHEGCPGNREAAALAALLVEGEPTQETRQHTGQQVPTCTKTLPLTVVGEVIDITQLFSHHLKPK